MELCYIWVEKFRNIENQNINLSTEFRFVYNPVSRELSMTKNPTYLPEFFGKRIANITGIIGQNASGKTNLLELMIYLAGEGTTKINGSFLVVIKEPSGEYHGFYHQMEEPVGGIRFSPYQNNILDFDTVYISNVFDGRRHNFGKETKDLSTNNLINNKFRENFHTLYNFEIQQQIRFINHPKFATLEDAEKRINNNSVVNFNPTHIRISSPTWGVLLEKSRKFDAIVLQHELKAPSLLDTCRWFRRNMVKKTMTDENALLYFTAFLVYIDFLINLVSDEGIKDRQILISQLNKLLEGLLFRSSPKMQIEDLYAFIVKRFSIDVDKKFAHEFERFRFLFDMDQYRFSNVIRQEQGKNSSRKVEFLINYNSKIGSFIRDYLEVVYTNTLSYSFEWEGISSGHKAYISLFSRFHNYYQRRRSKRGTILICMDEGDLYFHPKWQTEFLYKLVTILPEILTDERIQIVLSTHSPFLVSDLPYQNLLFLKKENSGNTVVMANKEAEKRTFGGNIGELYEDAFFLDNAIISQFAFEKISSLVDRVRETDGKNISEEDLLLIDMIGESLIRNKLKSIVYGENPR